MAERDTESTGFTVGQKVIFGRPQGEKTLGVIVGSTRTGKLKVRQVGSRGSEGQHADGQVWTVPADFVHPIPNEEAEPAADEVAVLPCFTVPVSYSGWSFSIDAREFLSSRQGWREVLSIGLHSAMRLHENNPRPVVVLGAWDQLREGRYILWFVMSTDGLVVDDLDELGLLFTMAPSQDWVEERQQPLPVGIARPLGLVHEGQRYVLVERDEGEPDEEELIEFFHYWNDGPCTGGTPFDGSPDDLPDLPRAEVEFVFGGEDELVLSLARQHLQAAVMYFAVWVLKEAGARSPRVHEWLLEHLPPNNMQWWGLLEGIEPTPLLEMLIEKVKTEPQRLFPADERREIANTIVWIAMLELPPEPRVVAATRALVELMGIDPAIYTEVLQG